MRLKIIAGNLVIVILTGMLAFFLVRFRLIEDLTTPIPDRLAKERELFMRSWKLSSYEFVDLVEQKANTREASGVFSVIGEKRRRESVYRFIRDASVWFSKRRMRIDYGRPDFVAVTDETGIVIARDTDINRMYGHLLAKDIPQLKQALSDDHAGFQLWYKKNEKKWLGVAVAPIHNAQDGLLGALVVGYDLSQSLALVEADLFARDIAFFADGRVYSSSLPKEATKELESFATQWEKEHKGSHFSSPSRRTWKTTLRGKEYVGLSGELPSTSLKEKSEISFAMLADHSKLVETADVSYSILIFVAIMAALLTAFGFFVGTSFLRPVEHMEETLFGVLNGKPAMRVDLTGGDFGGLAYRINQLINMATGVEGAQTGRLTVPPGASVSSQAAWAGSDFEDLSESFSVEPEPAPRRSGSKSSDSKNADDAEPSAVSDKALAEKLSQESEGRVLCSRIPGIRGCKSCTW